MCSNQNCSIILDSVFSNFSGIPFSTFGVLLYFSVFALCTKKIIILNSNKNCTNLEDSIIILLEFILCFFSFYFSLILKIFLQTNCPWCAFSMFISSVLLFFNIISKNENRILTLNYILMLIFGLSTAVYYLFFLNILEILNKF